MHRQPDEAHSLRVGSLTAVSRNRSARAPGLRASAVPATSRTAPGPYRARGRPQARLLEWAKAYRSWYATAEERPDLREIWQNRTVNGTVLPMMWTWQ